MPFRPTVNSQIKIDTEIYRFTEHPSAKGMPYGQTGRRATVYQLQDNKGRIFALKVFTKAFRTPYYERSAPKLRSFASLPGLSVCDRKVLTKQDHYGLISSHLELEYAVLMPWVEGKTWQEVILDRLPITPDQSLRIASELVTIVAAMEKNGVAHCDLSGPNVLLPGLLNGSDQIIGVVDVEDLYGAGLERPEKLPAGTQGYNHKVAKNGLWNQDADRYAAAVLLVEMLAWNDTRIRNISFGEQFFSPSEMQISCDRYHLVQQVLREQGFVKAADLFARAWFSDTLQECPSLADWYRAITNPKLDIEEVKRSLLEAEKAGNWAQVIEDLKYLLDVEPTNSIWLTLQIKAQRLSQMDVAIQQLWNLALSSGQVDDWDNCIRLLKTAQNQAKDVERYQFQTHQAEGERKNAVRVATFQQLIDENRWEEAQVKRNEIPSEHPVGAQLLAKIDLEMERRARLSDITKKAQEFFKARDWQNVIDASREGLVLDAENQTLKPLLESAYQEQSLDKQVEKLIQETNEHIQKEDWAKAEKSLKSAMEVQPARNELADWLKDVTQKRKWADKINLVKVDLAKNANPSLLERLKDIPDDFGFVRDLRTEIEETVKWIQDLALAKDSFDYEKVGILLDALPKSQKVEPGLVEWVKTQKDLHHTIQNAINSYDRNAVQSIVEQLPTEHPLRIGTMQWIDQIDEYEKNLNISIGAYDYEQVESILTHLTSEYPDFEKLQVWARDERTQVGLIKDAEDNYEESKASKFLDDLPTDHPLQKDLKTWIDSARKIRNQVENAKQNYLLKELTEYLESISVSATGYSETREWLKSQTQLQESLELCRANYDSEKMLSLLQSAPENMPKKIEWQSWAENDFRLTQNINKQMEAFAFETVEKFYGEISEEHPLKGVVKNWLNRYKNLAQELATALKNYDYKKVFDLLSEETQKYPDYEKFKNWALAEQDLETRLNSAIKNQDESGLRVIRKNLADNHPANNIIKKTLKEIAAQREEFQNQLKVAETNLKNKDWQNALAIANQYSNKPNAPTRFKEIQETAKSEIKKRNTAEEYIRASKKAISVKNYEEALSYAINALELVPGDSAYIEEFNNVRRTLVELARETESRKQWVEAKKIWYSLKTVKPGSSLSDKMGEQVVETEGEIKHDFQRAKEAVKNGNLADAVLILKKTNYDYAHNTEILSFRNQLSDAIRENAKAAEAKGRWSDAKHWWELLKSLREGDS